MSINQRMKKTHSLMEHDGTEYNELYMVDFTRFDTNDI